MKYLVLLLVIINFAFANDIERRRDQILKIVDEEVSEVQRLMRSSKKNPDLMLRLAELHLEKARLWRERENQRYLKINPEKRRKVKKSNFFKESNKYFNSANKLCLEIVKRFPKYKRVGEAYYILGFNAKEANKQKKASIYLSKAAKKSNNLIVKSKTQTTLAEVYYNQKKYRKAIPLYEKSLRKNQDKWWTKDSYNLAWCYYQTNNSRKAIDLLKDVYKRSADKRFIDMRNDVKRTLGLFFATTGKIDEGIKFYKSIGGDLSAKLIYIAGTLKAEGKFSKAERVYNEALKYDKRSSSKAQIYIEKLNLYGRSGAMNSHLNTARELIKLFKVKALNADQIKVFKFQLEKFSALLQRQVIAKTYVRLPKKRKAKASQANEYFEYLSQINTAKADEFKFLKGETAYAAKQNKEAYTYYKEAFVVSEKMKQSKFKMKAMEGMLASLSLKGNKLTDNYIETFEMYLRNWKTGKKAQGIYTRLFNNYLVKKDYNSAKRTLDRYTQNYSNDYKTQEAMIAKLMDIDRKNKNNASLRNWIKLIDRKKYKVSAKFQIKLKELLTTLQIEDVQKDLSSGNKKKALVGYMKVLDDPYSTKRSKINAKYNLSALYYELGDVDNAYKWSIEALKEMETKDVKQFSDSFITIANFLFTTLEFKKSANLSENLIYKICSQKHKKKEISFKNAVFIYLANNDLASTERLIAKAKGCRIKSSSIQLAQFELMREYKNQKKWQSYENLVHSLAKKATYKSKMVDEYLFLADQQKKFSNDAREREFRNKAKKLFYRAKKKKEIVSMRALDYFSAIEVEKMKQIAKSVNSIKYSFPEKTFQRAQQRKLTLLEKLTVQASEVQAIGSGVGIVNSFKILNDTYMQVAKDLFAFTPKNKSKEYITAFKKDMNTLGEQIKQAAVQYKNEALRTIKTNEILNTNNFYFQNNSTPVRFFGGGETLIMDRGGK